MNVLSWAKDKAVGVAESGIQYATGNEDYELGDATEALGRASLEAGLAVGAAGLHAADDLAIKGAELIGMESPSPFHDKVTSTEYEQALYTNICVRKAAEEAEHAPTYRGVVKQMRNLRDGDVLAFVGSGMTDKTIKMATGSEYGHVAVVCNCLRPPGHEDGDSPFIMESFASHHGHPVVDTLTDQIRSGTQCHVLFRRLDVMADDVWVHPLKEPLNEQQMEPFTSFLKEIHAEAAEYDYEQAYPVTLGMNAESREKFFCSELVAAALKAAGIFPPELNSSSIVPGHYMDPDMPEVSGVFSQRFLLIKAGHPSLERAVVSARSADEISRLKQKVLAYEAQLGIDATEVDSTDEIDPVTVKLFKKIDGDNDGFITKAAFKKAMTGKRKKAMRLLVAKIDPTLDWQGVFELLDANSDGNISLEEFANGFSM